MAEAWLLKGLFPVSSHVTSNAKERLLRAAAHPLHRAQVHAVCC